MPRFITCSILLAWLVSFEFEPGTAQELHLKTRTYDPLTSPHDLKSSDKVKTARSGRQRLIVQFTRSLTSEESGLLTGSDAHILGYIPDQAYVISIPDGFDWAPFPVRAQTPIAPTDKWSPLLEIPLSQSDERLSDERPTDPVFYLVLFHEDVPPEDARTLALNQFLEVREHPNLAPHHLLVQGPESVIRALTEFDEVAYILPASEDLAKGWPVVACENGIAGGVPLSPLAAAASTGSGWAANARTPVTLTTTWGAGSSRLDSASARAEIERALAEWSRVVQINFRPGDVPAAPRNLHFLFATRSHGDAYPFTGASGVIAHAFFPSPPNPEPISGDVHFNDDMRFQIGADYDLFSVALHEIGHALGLPHTDSSNTVMYPYYRKVTALTPTDVANIRALYLSTDAAAPATLRVTIAPTGNTTADTASLAGTVENGIVPIRVQWTNNRGGSGTVLADSARRWSLRNLPLLMGDNQFTLTATDAGSARASGTITVTRTANSLPTPAAPTLRISAPNNNDRIAAASIRLTGTANATQGLRRITWTTNSASGQAEGLTQWTIAALPLDRGPNLITLRAEATDGLATTATLTLIRDAAPSTVTDTVAPLLTVLSPNAPSVATSNPTVIVSGAANDAGGIAEVTWQVVNGPTGIAAGTTSWRAEIPLNPGFNSVVIRARDYSGNAGWRSITVTRR